LYICPKCKLGIYFPQIIGSPGFYIELQKETSDSYYVDEKWDFKEALNDVKAAKKIIEIGCGPGVFLKNTAQYVDQAVGVEYNKLALEIARNKGLSVFNLEDDLADLKGQFDAAFSFHVLEHVSDPVVFIQEMLAWVKPGGKIGISVPNMDGPVKYINPCVSNMPPHHATLWKLKTFQALAAKLDLEIERVAYEPLVARDYYYYSSFWLRQSFLVKLIPARFLPLLQETTSKLFNLLFVLLAKFNKEEFGLLNGQSIYVLMSKPENR
jgi:SAM-dependent methyltransferase